MQQSLSIPEDALKNLSKEIEKYPCRAFGNGILPLPVMDNYTEKRRSSFVRSKMDMGVTTVRRRSRITMYEKPMTFRMTGEEREVFDSLIHNELNGGEYWFYLPVRTGDYKLEVMKVQLLEIPGEDTDWKLVKCLSSGGSRWETTAKVQGFRNVLEKYNARVLSRNTLTSLERAGSKSLDVFG